MRITRSLRPDQELITRFLDVFGKASVILGSGRGARPGFFLFAHTFIHEYMEEIFFRKEDVLIRALLDAGFPDNDGPVDAIRTAQKKSHETAELLLNDAKAWQAGDEDARVGVGWASSEYSSIIRQHMDRLKNLIFPLLEQNLTLEDEHKIAEGFNNIAFEGMMKSDPDKFVKLIETLEDECSDWR
jgi:hemerythrin-like domain-containing protein